MRPFLCVALAACLTAPAASARTAATGVASWYGWREHGRLMADGRPFDALGHTAAHRTLPFGTRLRVTNLHNHRAALVTIEDRGPRPRDRIIDLSLGTARKLRMVQAGLVPVRLSIVSSPRHHH